MLFNNSSLNRNRPNGSELNFSSSSGNDGSFNVPMGRQMIFGTSAASFGGGSGSNNSGFIPFEMNRMQEILSKESLDHDEDDDEFAEIERRNRHGFNG